LGHAQDPVPSLFLSHVSISHFLVFLMSGRRRAGTRSKPHNSILCLVGNGQGEEGRRTGSTPFLYPAERKDAPRPLPQRLQFSRFFSGTGGLAAPITLAMNIS
jgi:hypothetical protein